MIAARCVDYYPGSGGMAKGGRASGGEFHDGGGLLQRHSTGLRHAPVKCPNVTGSLKRGCSFAHHHLTAKAIT